MLNTAATPNSGATPPPLPATSSPRPPQQAQQQQIQTQTPPQTHLFPPGGSQIGSPRETSSSPPPPSLQALSINDLFKSITSPPIGNQQQSDLFPVVSPPPKEDHKTNLLGMLKNIGSPATNGSGITSPGVGSGASSPAVGQEKPPHDPLGVFRVGHPSVSSPQEPVINHPGGLTSPPPPPRQTEPTTPGTTPQAKQPDMGKSPEPPKRSMFDFVSPFDVFEKPRQASLSKPPVPAPTPKAHQVPAKTQQGESKDVRPKSEDSQPAVSKAKSVQNISRTASPQRSQRGTPVPEKIAYISRAAIGQHPTHELSSEAITSAVESTWQVSKAIKGDEGRGPKALTPHTSIDLSQANLDALIMTPTDLQIKPTTLLRTDSLDFKQGRRVASTSTFIAYTMSKVMSASFGPIIDFAVTSNLVAAIGYDHKISVYRVPTSWEQNDPEVDMLCNCLGVGGPLGPLKKVEWVKKEGRDFLAIGGMEGVLVVDPSALGNPNTLTHLEDVVKSNKLLKTDGTVVDFCLNQTHQAIGILSATSQFTLYNVANLNRVWNRPLPTLSPNETPSSVQFCESNVLVGRGKNTVFELAQITVDMAVLSTIKFTSPSPSPENLHYTHAIYDSVKSILWVAPFSRGSIFAFKYALKGQQPIKEVSSPEGQKVVAFEKMAEFPLDPVLSLSVSKKTEDEDAEDFYATPGGFSQATISKTALAAPPSTTAETSVPWTSATLAAPTVPAPAKSTAASPKVQLNEFKKTAKESTPTGKASSKNASPAVVKTELLSASEDEGPSQSRSPRGSKTAPVPAQILAASMVNGPEAIAPLSAAEFTKTLKKTEDRMSNHLKQVLKNEVAALNARFDGLNGSDFAADISARVERQLKGALTNAVAQEIKKSVVPSITTTIQTEVRTVVANQIPAAIFDVLQTVPKELERGLTSTIQRTVSSVIQASMDRAIDDSIQQTLMPAIQHAGSTLTDQLVTELKSEMLQIRKEMSPVPVPPQANNDHLLRSMTTSISELQKQIASLSEQFAKFSAAPITAPHLNGIISQSVPPPPLAPPAVAQVPSGIPTAPPGISIPQLEDIFLTALGNQSTASTLQLVGEQSHLADFCLPIQPGLRSPLSQAVLLTLLHRLAIALNEIPPNHPMWLQTASWARRTASLIDPRDSNIAGFISRVLQVVQETLNQIAVNIQTRFGADPNSPNQVGMIRQIMDVVAVKLSAV
ncbi:hypothetical protein IAR55_004091 [Kwoniella newhampshirensis]|uniref:Enhancer of mRNA-decapping protein 4 WD40 repeat region domain-containing protein n=1 Tax=Kwoniella newhampshirensis TaxID=1651941 RepID=A0AAW0YYS7_9TREE